MNRLIINLILILYSIGIYAQTATAPASGDGTQLNPYEIVSLNNLYWVAAPETEVPIPTYAERMNSYYKQMNDIDAAETSTWFSGAGWLPIGNQTEKFNGTYDGQGFQIAGLKILRINSDNVGLFGVAENVYLRNINITTANIRGANYVSILVGHISFQGYIWNCTTKGFAVGYSYVGGITGRNDLESQIHFCSNQATINVGGSQLGGITGFNASGSVILHCNNSGPINWANSAGNYVGGIVGLNYGTVGHCKNSGNMGGKNYIGGVVGYNGFSVNKSSNSGSVSVGSDGSYLGGICGYHSGADALLSQSYNTGFISGGSLTFRIGGLVGSASNGAYVDNCYNLGRVDTYRGQYVAGGIGEVNASYVSNIYSAGLVSVRTTNTFIGGLIGGSTSSTVTGSFWDTQTSTRSTSAGGTGKTTDQMKELSIYTSAGWSFVGDGKRSTGCSEDCWDMDLSAGFTSGYPFGGSQRAPLTWNGSEDSDWDKVDNWTGSLGGPSQYKDITIPIKSNQPTITNPSDNPAKCASLTIDENASLTIVPNGALTVEGAIDNSGTLLIQSSVAGSGSLLQNNDNVPATVEVFVSGSSRDRSVYKYHLSSIPLADNILASESFMGAYLWQFDATALAGEEWVSIQEPTTVLNVREGYLTYVAQTTHTYSFNGNLKNGSFTSDIASTLTGNYNLIPNPYPAAIDWDAVDLSGSNLETSIWFFNSQTGNYTAYNGGVPVGGNIIPIGQSIFVKASDDSPVLELDNSVCLHNDKAFYKNNNEVVKDIIQIKVSANTWSDEAYVRFRESASNNFESENDASKLKGFSGSPQLYTLSEDDRELSINTMVLSDGTLTIPLGFELDVVGEACLSFEYLDSFDPGIDIYLQDLQNNNFINLRETSAYSYNPVPDELSTEEAIHILGVQGNLWGESMQRPYDHNYMLFPRLFAIAEVGWTADEQKDYNDFIRRTEYAFNRLDAMKVNYAPSMYNITISHQGNVLSSDLHLSLSSDVENIDIYYTLDGSNPTNKSYLFTDAFPIIVTSTIKAQAFKNGEAVGRISIKTINLHKAAGKKVIYHIPPNKKYNTSNLGLTDGLRGSADYTKDQWTAFRASDMELEIDLGKEKNVSTITASFLHSTGSWIFLPINVSFEISTDGKVFTEIGKIDYSDIAFQPGKYLKECTINFDEQKVRFIRVIAVSMKVNPQWHAAKGGENWIFIDEVIVD